MQAQPGIPDRVPARMLNEFTYCARLFHLEWVQREFADSADTVEGRSIHRRLDRPGRRLPPPGQAANDGAVVAARAVDLDAPELGMVAKIDLIESDGDSVVPVERKRGRPRPDGSVWEPEEMQVVAQALILRENGYTVERGEVSYPAARTRIDVPITPERETRLRRHLARLREVASGPIPPPLEDSPKCPRCSLVGICLPDETRLFGRTAAPEDGTEPVARRLIAPRPDAQPLHVQEQGARVGRSGDRVTVRVKDEVVAEVRARDVSSLSVYGNVGISAPAMRGFCEAGVPVTHHSYGGWLVGVTTGPAHRNTALRIRQFAVAADRDRCLATAGEMVAGKILNSRVLVRRNHPDRPRDTLSELRRLAQRARAAESEPQLLGIEGAAARAYFAVLGAMIADRATLTGFRMEGRTRRPPRDPVNAVLSFLYSQLVREVVTALVRVGLDPHVGVYHHPGYGRPSLALDLAEEFRPLLADSVALRLINTLEIGPTDLIERGGAYALTPDGRRLVIGAFERRLDEEVRHTLFGYTVAYRRVIELQARLLSRVFLGEFDTYRPFVTR